MYIFNLNPTLNHRQIYDDAVMELEKLDEKLMQEYAMPPLDFVG